MRRATGSTAISLAVHGGLLALAYRLLSDPAPAPRAPSPASSLDAPALIDVIPSAAPGPGAPRPAFAAAPAPAPPVAARTRAASASTHRGHDAPRTALLPTAGTYGELTVSVDTPLGPDVTGTGDTPGTSGSSLGGTLGTGLGGAAGTGAGGTLVIPEPPSLARRAQPRYDYSETYVQGSRAYTGRQIKLLLTIDDHGTVRRAHLVEGIELHFNLAAIRQALDCEFHPPLAARGKPVTSQLPWTFAVTL